MSDVDEEEERGDSNQEEDEESDDEVQLNESQESNTVPDEELIQARNVAAVKIQAIQRGIRDRAKVRNMKENGNLPSQQRATKIKPVVVRDPVKSHGELTFYDGIGSHYLGDLLDGLPHGKGRYTFVNGTVYEGDFIAGQFEGKGHYIFQGIGKVEATFVNGRAIGEALTFDDGLQYQPQGWKYCVEGDRRFYHEVVDPRFGLTD